MASDRFVCEIPLKNPTKEIEKKLIARLEFCRIAYNHCVTELNRRYGLMNESKMMRRLRAETKAEKTGKRASSNPAVIECESKKERGAMWRSLYGEYGLDGEYCLAEFCADFRKANAARVSSNAVPVTILHESAAGRAWRAFEPFLYHKPSGNGFRGQPRRRPWTKPFTTVTTRSTEKNHGAIQFLGDHVIWSNGLTGPKREVLTLKTMIDQDDVVIAHGLRIAMSRDQDKDGKYIDRVCQIRIGYREVKMRRRWFVQLVLDGVPLVKQHRRPADGTVGITIGVRHLAVVAPRYHLAQLLLLDDYISNKMIDDHRHEVIRSRAQDRSRRATNPEAFDEKGQYIPGQRARNRSERYKQLSLERREYNRIVNERKKTHRNTFANMVIRLGKSVHLPDLPYAKWQKQRGKAMLMSTPAAFADAIIRSATRAGSELIMIDAKKAKNMQRCHQCGKLTKRPQNKPVVSRVSDCICGRTPMQQHVYASFLACRSGEDGTLNKANIEKDWDRLNDNIARERTLGELSRSLKIEERRHRVRPLQKRRG